MRWHLIDNLSLIFQYAKPLSRLMIKSQQILLAEKLLDIWENTEVPSDKSRLMNCLEFSEIDYETESISHVALQEDIRKLEQELVEKCEMLLDVKPRAALDTQICRSIWP